MPSVVIEAECMGVVQIDGCKQLSLLKFKNESISPSLNISRGTLERGKFYRVTFEEIPGDVAEEHHEQKE